MNYTFDGWYTTKGWGTVHNDGYRMTTNPEGLEFTLADLRSFVRGLYFSSDNPFWAIFDKDGVMVAAFNNGVELTKPTICKECHQEIKK